MKRIKLYTTTGQWLDSKEYLNCRENLDISLEYDFDENVEVYFIADNGVSQFKGLVKDNKFSIPTAKIKKGVLKLKIVVVSAETLTQEFVVEDLQVNELDYNIYTLPEVVALKEQVETLSNKVNTLTKLVATLYNVDIKGVE